MSIRIAPAHCASPALLLSLLLACAPSRQEADGVYGGGAAGTNSAAGSGGAAGTGGIAGVAGAAVGGTAGTGGSAGIGGSAGGQGGGSGQCMPAPLTGTSTAKLRTVAYLPTWRGDLASWGTQLDYSKLSYINIAFADVDASGTLSVPTTGICELVNAAHASGVKVCAAIGGATTIDNPGVFGPLMQPANAPAFAQKILDFLSANNLDCLDVDLEGKGVTADYGTFIGELSAKLKPAGKQLTAAIAKWYDGAALGGGLPYFDFVNVMAYDLCQFWLTTPCEHSTVAKATEEMNHWVGRGVPASSLVLGVPFYGYRWQGGVKGEALTYSNIIQLYPTAIENDWVESGGATISHNGMPTIRAKAQLAKNYGGLMMWEVTQDATGPQSLLNAIAEQL